MMGAFGGMGSWGWGLGMGFGWITVLGLIVWGLLGATRRWRDDDTETYRRMRARLEG